MGQLLRFKLDVPEQTPHQSDYEFMCTFFIDVVRKCLKDNGYSKVNNNEEEIGTFLVGYKGKLYHIEDDLQVAENSKKYDTCGCGTYYAKGALFVLEENLDLTPEERIIKALETAVEFSGGVRPPFIIEKN